MALVSPSSLVYNPAWSGSLERSSSSVDARIQVKRCRLASGLQPITTRGSTQLMGRIGDNKWQISVYTGTSPPPTHQPPPPQPSLKSPRHNKTRLQKGRQNLASTCRSRSSIHPLDECTCLVTTPTPYGRATILHRAMPQRGPVGESGTYLLTS